eukprot:577712-Rhodomonas_salina.2
MAPRSGTCTAMSDVIETHTHMIDIHTHCSMHRSYPSCQSTFCDARDRDRRQRDRSHQPKMHVGHSLWDMQSGVSHDQHTHDQAHTLCEAREL